MKIFPLAAIGIGLILLVGSGLWPVLFPATRTWTDEKSRRLKELAAQEQLLLGKLEIAQHRPKMTGGQNPAMMKEQADEIRTEREALQAELTAATTGPEKMSSMLKWSGIVVLALGIVGHLATKEA